MESTTLFPQTPDGIQPVGKVAILYGTVKAVATDGTERVLTLNSPIFFGDHILTGPDGMVSIIFDADNTQLDLGRMSDAFIDQDVAGGEHAAAAEEIAAEVADIQQALVEGDIEQIIELPAPAAGGGVAGAGGGHPYPVFDIDGDAVLPEFGEETTGIGYDYLDPVGGGQVAEAPETEPIIAAEPDEPIIPPPPPPPPPPSPENLTPTIEVTDGMVWESALAETGTGIPEDGSVTSEGNITYTSPDGLAAMQVQDKDGNWIDVTNGGTVTGLYGNLVVTVTNGEYSWSYTLTQNWLDHDNTTTDSTPGDRGTDDQLFDNFAARVIDPQGDSTDADGIQPSEIITIAINDDGPMIGDPQDAILANEAGNSLVGDLDITFGADGQAAENVADELILNPLNDLGEKVVTGNYVVDNNGVHMTADGHDLVWMLNGDGSWSAVIPYYGDVQGETAIPVEWDTIFTIIPGADNNSYEVVMQGELDSLINVPISGTGGGHTEDGGYRYISAEDGSFYIRMSATEPNNTGGFDPASVNWSDQGTGVENDHIDGVDDGILTDYQTESEALIIGIFDNDDNPYSVQEATFGLDKLDEAHEIGNSGKTTADEVSYWYAYEDGVLVGTGVVEGESQGASSNADQTVTVKANIGDYNEFDTVVFTGGTLQEGDSDGYRVTDMSVADEEHTITVAYTATDGDLDQDSSTFDVTFDSDSTIEGTSENEVISGSTGDDDISGGGGDDVIYGHEGDDTIEGGNGNDTLVGGEGEDELSGDSGNDALDGGTGADTLDGGEGDDVLLGGEDDTEPDIITGGAGDDTFDTDEATDPGSPDTTDYGNDSGDNLDDLVPPVEPDATS